MVKLPGLNLKKPIEKKNHEIRLPASQTKTEVLNVAVMATKDDEDPEAGKGTLVSNLGEAIKVAGSNNNETLPPLNTPVTGQTAPLAAQGVTSAPLIPLAPVTTGTAVCARPLPPEPEGDDTPFNIGNERGKSLNHDTGATASASSNQPSREMAAVSTDASEEEKIDRSAKTPLPQENPLLDMTKTVENAVISENPDHYEVNVQRYACYDNLNQDGGYDAEAQASIQYAAKTPWGRFISDFLCVMARPIHFWECQSQHPATVAQAHVPHLVVLVLARAVASFVGGVLQKDTVLVDVLLDVLIQALMIFVFVWALGFVYAGVLVFVGRRFELGKAINFVAYAITPVLVIGLLSIIPIAHFATICDLVAMPYAFVVLGAGILPYLKIREKTAPIITGLFCGLMACLWGLLPTLIPILVSLLQEPTIQLPVVLPG